MGYLLLWIENLAVSLLIVAFVVACAARVSGARKRPLVWLPATAIVFLIYLALTVFLGYVKFWRMPGLPWYYSVLWLLLLYTAGAAYFLRTGFRRREGEFVAAAWPRGKIGAALLIVLSVHVMTFWNLDAEARQRLITIRAQADSDAISAAPLKVLDQDNAAPIYSKFAGALNPEFLPKKWKQWGEWVRCDDDEFKRNDSEISAFLAKQSGIIAAINEASRKPACVFPHNYHWWTIDVLAPELLDLRRFASLLGLHARWSIAHGDLPTALRDIGSVNRISRHMIQNPILVSLLVGAAIEKMALEETQNALNAGASESAMAAIEETSAFSFEALYPTALRTERSLYFATIASISEDGALAKETLSGAQFSFIAQSAYRIFLAPSDFEIGSLYFRHLSAQGSLPYYKTSENFANVMNAAQSSGSALLLYMLPTLSKARENVAAGDASVAAMNLGIVAHRYQLKNGKLPDALDDLVPEFIPFVPIDPFDGKPMKYERSNDDVLIYSVGPNGKDDGDSPKKNDDIVFTLKALPSGKK